MNENLKVIKVLHQVVMVVTAVIVAFFLRPDQTHQYEAAIDELAALKQVSYGSWSNNVAKQFKPENDRNEKFLYSVVRQAGVPVQANLHIGIPVFGDQLPLPTSRLLDLDTFLTRTQKIGALKWTSDREKILKELANWKASRSPQAKVIQLSLGFNSGLQYPDGSPMLDWINRSPSDVLGLTLYLQTDESSLQPGHINLQYSITPKTDFFASDWLRNDMFGQKLIDPKTGVVFPHSKVFWHQINQDSPDQATVFLQGELAASTRGTLSFFGISVERSLAVLAGPIVTFCVLLFLVLHLRHFRSLNLDPSEIRKYPWVGLFRGWFAATVTNISILVLPALANTWLVYKFGQLSELSTKIGATATVLLVIAGTVAVIDVRKIRKQTPGRIGHA